MPPPIIATIASSQLFPISTGGSAYFYPKILDSNDAALSSRSNADGNGSSFGHFYKNLLSSSSALLVYNTITFCNICNYAGDSTATVSLWTSTGKYLQVPLVGPTYTTIRKNMIAKEGVIINTVSTSSLYSTGIYYDSTIPPESNFFFKEGTYSTIIAQNEPSTPGSNFFSFADAVYLNYHKTGMEVLFTTNHNTAGDSVVIASDNWDGINTTLDYNNPSTNITPVGDLSFTTYCSNASGSLRLNLTMCNLEPSVFLRGADVAEIDGIAYPNISNFSNVTICNFNAIAFPGDAYVSNSLDFNTYQSGSVCIYSQIDPAGNSYSNEGTFSLFNFGDSYNYETDSKNNEDIITFGPNTVDHVLPTHSTINWNLATVTFSNYIQNRSNYYDLYTYYNANLQYSNLTNAGHTSSFISNYITIGSNYPGALMNVGLFDRCLCKREIELYMDVVYSELAGGGGSDSGSESGGSSEEPPPG